MRIRLLGPVEMWTADDQQVDLGPPQQRCVFAVLAITPGQPVSVETLMDRVWSERRPATARNVLYTHVSRLRSALDGNNGWAVLRRRGGGYVLDVDPDRVDLHRARRLAGEAREAATSEPGGYARAAELLSDACALWSATPLGGIAGDWAERVRVALERERLALLTERFDAALRCGEHDTVIGPLSESVAAHPLAESLVGLLMLALHRSGRQAEALAAFSQLRRYLLDGLGDEPGPGLRRLHQQILRRDPDLVASDRVPYLSDRKPPPSIESTEPDRPAESWASLCQLPPDTRHLVGRNAVIERLVAALDPDVRGTAVPVVTVSGPPGVGKTALALRVAHTIRDRYPDGQWYVSLGGAAAPREPGQVLTDLLEAAGTHSGAVPAELDRRTAALRSRLADRRVLILLDDAADAAQVRPLVPGNSGSAVLVTSRGMLSGLAESSRVRLGPLAPDDAVELLGRLAGPDRVAAEPAAASEVSAACGRLPLALRVAAARLVKHPGWTIERFAARLRDQRRRLDELAVDDLDVRAALQLSYQALDPPLQLALRRIGSLGAADLASWAIAALADQPDGERVVDGLIEANLLDSVGTDATGEPRYQLHDLVETYAAELSEDDDAIDTCKALHRHADMLLALSESAYRRLHVDTDDLPATEKVVGSSRLLDSEVVRLTSDPVAWLIAERIQLVSTIERACRRGWHEEAAQLADRVLTHVVRAHIGPAGIRRLYELVRDAATRAGDDLLAWRATCRLYTELAVSGRIAAAADGLFDCAAAFERIGAPAEFAFSLSEAAKYRMFLGADDVPLPQAERAIQIARDCGDRQVEATTTRNAASVLAAAGRYGEAVELFDRSLDLATDQALVAHRTVGLLALAVAAYHNDDLDRADRAQRAAMHLVDETTDPRGVAWLLYVSAVIASGREQPGDAVRAAKEAGVRFADLGDARGEACAAEAVGLAWLASGAPARAVQPLMSAARIFGEIGMPEQAAAASARLTEAARAAHDPPAG